MYDIRRPLPFDMNRPLKLMLLILAIVWLISAFSPTDRKIWLVENILLIASIILLATTYNKFTLSNRAYCLIFLFLLLHTYGAHYTYQGTPIDAWLKSVFPLKRSYYDRFVHFAFGLLWVLPVYELMTRAAKLRGFWSYALTAVLVFALSSFFEVIEMLAAVMMGEQGVGGDYLGMQGDVFDSQKDMGLGLSGALFSAIWLAWLRRKRIS
ncbi:DUF2238 domain-containing protein [Paenibacillus koleovorans]|uniref:DUF2238 domain-containing protein n=1 Tax=Paenibacillus koleovorans TaxID=121608 RepID=UPI001FE24E60|nr:DUF2238 domain-containing protein [Paenibacillus koleovorans]